MSAQIATLLERARTADGGFGAQPGGSAEPEPTAMAVLALDDARARAWLTRHQDPDGAWRIGGRIDTDSATALAALAVDSARARQRALDHLVATPARPIIPGPEVVLDPSVRGWGWTPTTVAWVEPTARALLALRLHRPSATAAIADAVAYLADRACIGGGWNYGNKIVLDVTLDPYLHPSAMALIGMHGLDSPTAELGLGALKRLSVTEPGGLSLATALAALRLWDVERDLQATVRARLQQRIEISQLLGDTVALAWAMIATTDRLEQLRVKP